MGYKILAPSVWQEFERKTKELLRLVINDPNGQLHGRSGQKQLGVDFYGYRDSNIEHVVGVQCKEKSWNKQLTESELEREVNEATKFEPAIKEFIVVTTAPDDAKIQKKARELEQKLTKTSTPFRVVVWGWGSIQDEIIRFKDQGMLKLWCPELEEYAKQYYAETVAEKFTAEDYSLAYQQISKVAVEDAEQSANEAIDKNFQHDLDVCRDKLRAGQFKTALELLKIKVGQIDENTGDWTKFRIYNNIGACYHNMGETKEAIKHFEYAYGFSPNNPIANANYVVAAYLKKDAGLCKARAEAACLLEEIHPHTFVHLIFTAETQDELVNIVGRIPEPLKQDPEIVATRIGKLKDFSLTEWKKQALEQADHASLYVRKIWADAILDDYTAGAGLALGMQRSGACDDLPKAVEIYQSLWEETLSLNTWKLNFHIAFNLAVAFQVHNQSNRALDVLDEALAKLPDNRHLRYQKATLLASMGNKDEARNFLEDVELDPEVCLFLANLYLGHDNKKSLQLLKSVQWSNCDQILQIRARSTQFSATYNKTSKKRLVNNALNRMATDFPDSIIPMCLKTQYQLSMAPDDAAETIDLIRTLIPKLDSAEDIINAAESLHLAGHHDEAFDILFEKISFDRNSSALELLINCGRMGSDPSRFIKLFKNLDPKVIGEARFHRLKADLGYKTLDLQVVKEGIIGALKYSNDDIALSIQYIDILLRLGEDDLIPEFIRGIDFHFQGTLRQNTDFIARIGRFYSRELAFNLLYKWVMENPNDAEIYNFAVHFYLSNSLKETDWLEYQTVQPNCFIEVKSENGETHSFVITEEESLHKFANHFPPEHQFVKSFIGLKASEETIDQSGRRWTVLTVKFIHLHMFHDLLKKVNVLTAEKSAVQKFHVDAENPNFDEIFKVAEDHKKHASNVLDHYKKQALPLRMASDSLGLTPMDFHDSIANEDILLLSSSGGISTLKEAVETVLSQRENGCVMDAVTLHCIHSMGLIEKVQEYFGTISGPQSLIDLHIERYEKSIAFGNTSGGTLISAGDKFELMEYTATDSEAWVDIVEGELSATRKSVQLEAITIRPPVEEDPEFLKLFPSNFWDDALIAKQTNSLLISEDRIYRELASQKVGASSVWLQPLLMALCDEKIITLQEYSDAVAYLSLFNHSFVSVNSDVLYYIWGNEPGKLDIVLKNLFCDNAEVQSHLFVAFNFLQLLWADNTPNLAKYSATGKILERMMQPRYVNVAGLITALLRQSPLPSGFKIYLHGWCKGHFLKLS